MAIFSTNKNKTKNKTSETTEEAIKETKKVSKKVATVKTDKTVTTSKLTTTTPAIADTSSAGAKPLFTLIPHVTEKANFHAETANSYTFKVVGNSNKKSIAYAVKTTYKVTPLKIRIVNTAERRTSNRGRIAYTSGFKKAYVTLKKGDKIEIA